MKYSPLDIAHQTFRGRLFGYDKAAVHTFLSEAGSQLEDLLREDQHRRETLERLEQELSEKRAAEDELRRAIVSAERIAHEMRDNAVRESELMVAQAQTQAQDLRREQEVRAAQFEAEHQERVTALEIAFRERFAALEREENDRARQREREHAERTAHLEAQYSARALELATRNTAARQEYAQFISGYRALVGSFADLSRRHRLPDETPPLDLDLSGGPASEEASPPPEGIREQAQA